MDTCSTKEEAIDRSDAFACADTCSKDALVSTVRAKSFQPRQDVLVAYAGRIHSDTTEEQLSDFLVDEGMKGVVCRKLVCM